MTDSGTYHRCLSVGSFREPGLLDVGSILRRHTKHADDINPLTLTVAVWVCQCFGVLSQFYFWMCDGL